MGSSYGQNPQLTKKAPVIPGLKIVIIGDCEVGKTSICTRFLNNQFSPLYIPTNKVNINNLVQKINQPSHALVSMTLWDTPGREEINMHSRYFRDVDAIIVVADLTDETSIRMAPVWKQLALNSATATADEDRLPGTLQVPVLLVGSKLDVIEEELFTKLSKKAELEDRGRGHGEGKTRAKKSKPDIEKPECVRLLQEVADKAFFDGCAVVSAKSGDGSVNQAIKFFVRNIMENQSMLTRRWQPQILHEREKKSRDRLGSCLESVGIEQFDDLFSQGQVLVTRLASLDSHFKETLRHFQDLCLKAKVVTEEESSLENCLVGLKEALAEENIKLKLVVKEGFCQLAAESRENVEIKKHIRRALKAFNKEFAAVCLATVKELPIINSSMETLDTRLDRLITEFKVTSPPQQASTPDVGNDNEAPINVKTASHVVERNRGVLVHTQHQAKELGVTIENALKRARTAYVW